VADLFELGASGTRPAISVGGRHLDYADLRGLGDQARRGIADRHTSVAPVAIDLAGLDVVDTLTTIFAAAAQEVPVLVRDPGAEIPSCPALGSAAFLVAMTSGTSGRPRAVVRTAASWSASFRPLTALTGLRHTDVVLLTGPLHSTLHLFAAVHTLWLGGHLTDEPSIATAAHLVPALLADLLLDPPPCLRLAVVAGARLSPALERRATQLGLRLVEYYGAAEMSFVAARVAPEPLRPFPGVQVRVTDGELWARSPYLALARIGNGPPLRRSFDGFVTVGDLAQIMPDGSIVVRGRGDSAVTTGGHTVLVEDVEAVLSGLPGVLEVAVIGIGHLRLGQVVTAVLVLADGVDLAQIRRRARSALTGPSLPRRWRTVSALPRTAGGKIARGALATGATNQAESPEGTGSVP
jgi:long-chain acyl-CoA synthetase